MSIKRVETKNKENGSIAGKAWRQMYSELAKYASPSCPPQMMMIRTTSQLHVNYCERNAA
jgi:hypothetical protein